MFYFLRDWHRYMSQHSIYNQNKAISLEEETIWFWRVWGKRILLNEYIPTHRIFSFCMSNEERSASSASTSELSILCSFNTYDGVFVTLKMSNRRTIRHLKRRVLQELTNVDLSELASLQSITDDMESIYVDSMSSPNSVPSTKSSVSASLSVVGIDGKFYLAKLTW